RAGNEVDDGFMAQQRSASPILGDETEQPVLNLVPFAGAWRKMTYVQFQPQRVRQVLQRYLPQTRATAVAAPSIRGDQQFLSSGKPVLAHFLPPAPNAIRGKLGRVVVDPDADPTLVVEHVVHPVRDRFAKVLDQEIVDPNLFGCSFRQPFP